MPFVKSLPENATAYDVWKLHPQAYANWPALTNSAMGVADSQLSPGEQEMIGAYASAIRGCTHCYTAHYPIAEAYGIDADVFRLLIDDFDNAPIDDKLRPILCFVKKLTREPEKLVQRDVDPIFASGWSEQTFTEVVMICCIFAFMNTLMMGHGADKIDMSKLGPLAALHRGASVYNMERGATLGDPEAMLQKSVEQFGEDATQSAIAFAAATRILGNNGDA